MGLKKKHFRLYQVADATAPDGVEYGFRCRCIWSSRHKTRADRKTAMQKHISELLAKR